MNATPAVGPLVYLGTPEVAVPPLRALVAAGHDVVLVVTNPDRRRGRGGETTPSPVKTAALELGLPVSHDVDDVVASGAVLGVVVAFGQLISDDVLETVPMVNLHFSLLPRWRGAAPVEWTILSGDDDTGVCLIEVASQLDAGGIFAEQRLALDGTETLSSLWETLSHQGARLLVGALVDGLGEPREQVGEVVWARKISTDDLRLDFEREAEVLHRIVRVGRAHTTFRGRRFLILDAEVGSDASHLAPGQIGEDLLVGTGSGSLRMLTVQPEGKRSIEAEAWANGARPTPDDRLGT